MSTVQLLLYWTRVNYSIPFIRKTSLRYARHGGVNDTFLQQPDAFSTFTAAILSSAFADFAVVPIDIDYSAALDSELWLANFVLPLKVLTIYKVPPVVRSILGDAKLLHIPSALFGSVQALDPKDGF